MTENQRLLDQFVPDHYDIYLDISRQDKRFSGTTTVSGQTKGQDIVLNQKYLTTEKVTVDGELASFSQDDQAETLTIANDKEGQVEVAVTYHANLTDSMMGIYPSYYEVDGEEKQLVGTQFETTFARQAFPCVDEPAAKATFSLAIKFDEQAGETIIANQPEVKCENGVHYFEETVRMSSYLIAFVFGDLQKKITHTKSGVEIGVFATKAHAPKELDFALDISKRSIEFFEEFYDTPYPLEHSYQVGLPDFSAGAMENWGLVTYREAYLLIDPDNASLPTKQLVATVIAHELAHQWFGNLVTMNWWDDLWLNESFANMMEYAAIDALEPEWKVWELFQTSDVPAALERDATDGVQSVHVMVNDPAEIDSIFDPAIVYAKGARLLVMVRSLLGDDDLRKGLKAYFEKHQYGNAKGQDLWYALSQASGLDIGAIMDSWLEQPGYPVVSAKLVDGDLVLSQEQFFIGQGQDQGRLWQIPLQANNDQVPEIMTESEITVSNFKKGDQALRLNVGNNSHFIVDYDEELLKDIIDELDQLTAIDQLQVLQDLNLLAKGGRLSYAKIIPLLDKLAKAESAIVHEKIAAILSVLKDFARPKSEEEAAIKEYIRSLYHDQVEKLGVEAWVGESLDDELSRPTILAASLYAEDKMVIEGLHELYLNSGGGENKEKLPADRRALLLKNEVVNYGSDDLCQDYLTAYQKSANPSLKADLRQALTASKDETFLDQIVGHFQETNVIKPQDLRAWYRGVLANPAGEEKAWNWLRNNWDWLEAKVGGDMEFATYITVTAGVFNTEERLEEFKDFFEEKVDVPGLGREIRMDIKVIEGRVDFIKKEKDAVLSSVETANNK
ncbi:M1 family metallopeptidase [Aerococcus urinae]|uniref:Aminopeptidase n=1 Tax=Aerococcus urinae TaxID=1376 RepID=A0A109RFV5_9LACT|nr:M1 family metallopeptidase [Aerococcus urinae]AMB95951.1 peptidase [Aerococcus urinae]MCY3032539.1 M1 family metallopeptidase [Aerococcus urinae]MCY3038497.1 M1 family metallopeptidase [Aerococcus urinae]MCY3044585.1 M1 family metallopeptidase [Aerococcus urinae]MCY3048040.1 M1 family metallopeptidase [Aerococcus urinae]